MERVLGIGGFFPAAADPSALAQWYADHLGVDLVPESYGGRAWWTAAGVCVFAPMPTDSEHLAGRSWAINFRVADLDAMVAQLRTAGVEVSVHAETYPNGRFADLTDPEGNGVQLWQPDGADALPS
jgi:glyoxylase I family protein